MGLTKSLNVDILLCIETDFKDYSLVLNVCQMLTSDHHFFSVFLFSGRGRGECGFYQRSFDEVEGVFGRGGGREMHRSQSWEER